MKWILKYKLCEMRSVKSSEWRCRIIFREIDQNHRRRWLKITQQQIKDSFSRKNNLFYWKTCCNIITIKSSLNKDVISMLPLMIFLGWVMNNLVGVGPWLHKFLVQFFNFLLFFGHLFINFHCSHHSFVYPGWEKDIWFYYIYPQ